MCMDEKEQDNVAAFDLLFTTNQIQLMKVLLPCFSPSIQKYLAIYIKQQELQYTISYLKRHTLRSCEQTVSKPEDILRLLPALLPYCNEAQKKMLQQLEQTLSSFQSYQEIMEMMQMMQDMSAASGGCEMPFDMGGASMPDAEMLLSLLSPEQKNLMEMLKGDTPNESTDMDG